LRCNDFCNPTACHDLPNTDRWCIRGGVTHAAAHIRIERQVKHANKNLPEAGLRSCNFFKPEIFLSRLADWALREYDTAVGRRDHYLSFLFGTNL
jgi:hypothetical protein